MMKPVIGVVGLDGLVRLLSDIESEELEGIGTRVVILIYMVLGATYAHDRLPTPLLLILTSQVLKYAIPISLGNYIVILGFSLNGCLVSMLKV